MNSTWRPSCFRLLLTLSLCSAGQIYAVAAATSADYNITANTIDTGGAQVSSADYTDKGSLGGVAGLSAVASPAETMKSGYIGELYQVTGLELAPTFVDDGTTQQLNAMQTLDDGTLLDLMGGNESWSVIAGQLPAGLMLDMTTGVITGTPGNSGAYSFTVLVTDGLGDSAQQVFSGSGLGLATTDTPTLPPWGMALLTVVLLGASATCLKTGRIETARIPFSV